MIEGQVNEDGVPQIPFKLAGRDWLATIDTGFNGGLELPVTIKFAVGGVHFGPVVSELASGVTIVEEAYIVEVHFDGEKRQVQATYCDDDGVLIGTELLSQHRLEIDFPARTVQLTKSDKAA
jgi:predicted aspartyl protease